MLSIELILNLEYSLKTISNIISFRVISSYNASHLPSITGTSGFTDYGFTFNSTHIPSWSVPARVACVSVVKLFKVTPSSTARTRAKMSAPFCNYQRRLTGASWRNIKEQWIRETKPRWGTEALGSLHTELIRIEQVLTASNIQSPPPKCTKSKWALVRSLLDMRDSRGRESEFCEAVMV